MRKANAMSGEEFRRRRLALGLQQQSMAEKLHVAVTTIQNYEAGRTTVSGMAQAALEMLEEKDRMKGGRDGDGI